MKYVYSVKRTG